MARRRRRLLWLAAAVVVVAAVAVLPASRRIGINRVVTVETLPFWIKTVDFIDRDLNLDRTADAVLGGVGGDEARALTALAWTREHVRRQPAGLPAMDDHVWYVIVRGYGESDQQADVFSTLLTYAGVPAYWTLIGTRPEELPLSYVRIDGDWRVFDVAHGLVFRRRDGALATPEDLVADPAIVPATARGAVPDLEAYLGYFDGYRVAPAPDVLRADLQMPGRRLLHEARALVGLEGRVWSIRPLEPAQGASQ